MIVRECGRSCIAAAKLNGKKYPNNRIPTRRKHLNYYNGLLRKEQQSGAGSLLAQFSTLEPLRSIFEFKLFDVLEERLPFDVVSGINFCGLGPAHKTKQKSESFKCGNQRTIFQFFHGVIILSETTVVLCLVHQRIIGSKITG